MKYTFRMFDYVEASIKSSSDFAGVKGLVMPFDGLDMICEIPAMTDQCGKVFEITKVHGNIILSSGYEYRYKNIAVAIPVGKLDHDISEAEAELLVGRKVKIRKMNQEGFITQNMIDNYTGKVGIIRSVDNDGHLHPDVTDGMNVTFFVDFEDGDSFWFYPQNLKVMKEDFQIGDVIFGKESTIGNYSFTTNDKVMVVREVYEHDKDNFRVQIVGYVENFDASVQSSAAYGVEKTFFKKMKKVL